MRTLTVATQGPVCSAGGEKKQLNVKYDSRRGDQAPALTLTHIQQLLENVILRPHGEY